MNKKELNKNKGSTLHLCHNCKAINPMLVLEITYNKDCQDPFQIKLLILKKDESYESKIVILNKNTKLEILKYNVCGECHSLLETITNKKEIRFINQHILKRRLS